MNKICVIGTGYVGLVTSVCLASLGHMVYGLDMDAKKIKALCQGNLPLYEPGLEELLKEVLDAGKVVFTTSYEEAVPDSDVIFLCLPTPSAADGAANTDYITQSLTQLSPYIKEGVVVVNKSTVPVGTGEMVETKLHSLTKKQFSVASNPEFLREGSAVEDFFAPDRIVIGAEDRQTYETIAGLYERIDAPILSFTRRTAEMVKYASNAFLATKISFINEIADICEQSGANVSDVAKGMGLDGRIGSAFLHAGLGFGGSCFFKDIRALQSTAKKYDVDTSILDATLSINAGRITHVCEKVIEVLGSLKGKQIIVLGLAFKAQTDDTRESQALALIEELVKKGADIVVYDPVAKLKSSIDHTVQAESMKEVYDMKQKDMIILATAWEEFQLIDFDKLKEGMMEPFFYDTRNYFSKKEMEEKGFRYIGMGK